MEDFSVRAIVIGVSVFVTMLTLSAILIYFNTAKGIADKVSKRADIASNYDNIMNAEVFEDEISGVEVRSLINKYAGNKDVQINIVDISGIATNKYVNINNSWNISLNDNASLISDEKMNLINPVWNNRVNKVENGNKIILEISLDVED